MRDAQDFDTVEAWADTVEDTVRKSRHFVRARVGAIGRRAELWEVGEKIGGGEDTLNDGEGNVGAVLTNIRSDGRQLAERAARPDDLHGLAPVAWDVGADTGLVASTPRTPLTTAHGGE